MGDFGESCRYPGVLLRGYLLCVLTHAAASVCLAACVFSREPVLDYGIGTTTRSALWAGPIGRLRGLIGLGAYFGVLGCILGSAVFLWLVRGAMLAESGFVRLWCAMGAPAWGFLSGAALFSPGCVPT